MRYKTRDGIAASVVSNQRVVSGTVQAVSGNKCAWSRSGGLSFSRCTCFKSYRLLKLYIYLLARSIFNPHCSVHNVYTKANILQL